MKPSTIKILMVEGDTDDVYSLKEALTVAQIVDVEVQEVEDGEQALAYLRKEYPFIDAPRPHLIFLGLNLPDMSGRELLDMIKTHAGLKKIPVAVLTTSTDNDELGIPHDISHHCYTFKKPLSCDQWIYTLRCIEDVWLTIKTMPGQRQL